MNISPVQPQCQGLGILGFGLLRAQGFKGVFVGLRVFSLLRVEGFRV